MNPLPLTRNHEQSWIETIWQAVDPILETMPDEQRDDFCTAMAWICEELNNAGCTIDDQY
jgi:truncated hemoglobin YjbI